MELINGVQCRIGNVICMGLFNRVQYRTIVRFARNQRMIRDKPCGSQGQCKEQEDDKGQATWFTMTMLKEI